MLTNQIQAILRRLRTKSSAAMLAVNQGSKHISPVTANNRSLQDEDLSHIANEPKLRRVTLTSPMREQTRMPAQPASPGTTPSLTHDSTGSYMSASNGIAGVPNLPPSASSNATFQPPTSALSSSHDASPIRLTGSQQHEQVFTSPDLDRRHQSGGGVESTAHATHRSPFPTTANPGHVDLRAGPPFIAASSHDSAYNDNMHMSYVGDAHAGQDFDMHLQYLAGMAPTHENLGNLDDFQTFLFHMQTDNYDQA